MVKQLKTAGSGKLPKDIQRRKTEHFTATSNDASVSYTHLDVYKRQVFKLVQELLAPSRVKGKNQFQLLLEKLPPNHKARWFAGSALNTCLLYTSLSHHAGHRPNQVGTGKRDLPAGADRALPAADPE